MPVHVFFLGPDYWDDGVVVPAPVWVKRYLGAISDPFTPKDLRRCAAEHLVRASGGEVRGVIMDPKEQQEGEDDLAFFQRLEQEHDIQAYFIVLPLGAKIHGTFWEGAMLSRDKLRGENPRIALFIQDGFAREDDDGVIHFDTPAAKGKRLPYLTAFVNKYVNHVELWTSFEGLVDLIEQRGRALLWECE